MRTTLDLDEDILTAAKEIARAEHKTAGQVISDLARRALTTSGLEETQPQYRGGFRLMRPTKEIITSEMVRRLLEEDE
jgi:hypothetical protein